MRLCERALGSWALCVALACAPPEPTDGAAAPSPTASSPLVEDARVFEAAAKAIVDRDELELFVVRTTRVDLSIGALADARDEVSAHLPDVPANAVADLYGRSPEELTIRGFQALATPTRLVTPERLAEIHELDERIGEWDWPAFYHEFPDSRGYWAFSPVGYDATGSEALVYVVHACGALCASGHWVHLKREARGWSVAKKSLDWIS